MTSTKKEVFPEIYVGDVVVSLITMSRHREEGDIFEVLPQSFGGTLFYPTRTSQPVDYVNSTNSASFRKATQEEIQWYRSTRKQGMFLNIKNMPSQIINNYSIY